MATESEAAADDDRPVSARQVELVQGLCVEIRREPFRLGARAAMLEHVGRDVAAVDVEPCAQPRDEQPAGPARGIQRRLAFVLDEALEVRDLGAGPVELGPPLREHTVMPGLGAVPTHAASLLTRKFQRTNGSLSSEPGAL